MLGVGPSGSQVFTVDREVTMQKIKPFLWLEKDAVEAAKFYASVFRNSRIKSTSIIRDTPSGNAEIVTVELLGQEFTLLAGGPFFKFNEAISFVVSCENQEEIDYYWNKLSADPKAEQCGWLKDKYGLSWQIVPMVLAQLLADEDPKKVARVTKAFLQMKKLDIAELRRAHDVGS
jgi:predicted 3-demethylubiquinone-9 3-methyltransferase (glyoxalase superfamily)